MRVFSLLVFLAALAVPAITSAAEDSVAGGYVGASSGVLLPGNGNTLRRAAEVSVRGGYSITDYLALEVEGVCVPSAVSRAGGNATVSGVSFASVWHFAGWETFDRLFGCERFDPFMTLGVGSRWASRDVFGEGAPRAAIGPVWGIGAFYHLTESWSLRADARAQLCCDSSCGMLYGVSLGVQYSWGNE